MALTFSLISCQENGEFHQAATVSPGEAPAIIPAPAPVIPAPKPVEPPVVNSSCDTSTNQTWISEYCKGEVFSQALQMKKLDILWVIDDSGSMQDKQNALGFNFDAFIKDFMGTKVDFRMAITTTDKDKNGQMVPNSSEKLTS